MNPRRPYRHPDNYAPRLAFGGHEFRLDDDGCATCRGCGVTVPLLTCYDGTWEDHAARWCPAKIAALPPAGP